MLSILPRDINDLPRVVEQESCFLKEAKDEATSKEKNSTFSWCHH